MKDKFSFYVKFVLHTEAVIKLIPYAFVYRKIKVLECVQKTLLVLFLTGLSPRHQGLFWALGSPFSSLTQAWLSVERLLLLGTIQWLWNWRKCSSQTFRFSKIPEDMHT